MCSPPCFAIIYRSMVPLDMIPVIVHRNKDWDTERQHETIVAAQIKNAGKQNKHCQLSTVGH